MRVTKTIAKAWRIYDQGHSQDAKSAFEKAAADHPHADWIQIQYGLFLLQEEQFYESIASLSKACTLAPKNPAPLFFLSLAQELANLHEQAYQSENKLTKLCPQHQGLVSLRLFRELRHGQPLAALHTFGYGEKAPPRKESFKAAFASLGIGDPSWLPQDLSSSRYLLGPILVEIERQLLPLEYPTIEPSPPNMAESLDKLAPPVRTLTEEIRSFPRSLRATPTLHRGKSLLNKALSTPTLEPQPDLLRQAISSLETGLQLDPYAFRTHYHLGEAYLWSARNEPGHPYLRDPLSKAEYHFTESIRLDGSNPYVLFLLALTYQLVGQPHAALSLYAKATEKFTKMPEAHYGMGQCYLLLGDSSLARKFLLRAVESDLAIAKERITLYTNLLESQGPDAFKQPFPQMPSAPTASITISPSAKETPQTENGNSSDSTG